MNGHAPSSRMLAALSVTPVLGEGLRRFDLMCESRYRMCTGERSSRLAIIAFCRRLVHLLPIDPFGEGRWPAASVRTIEGLRRLV
jgi:hypothetical protein